MALWHPGLDGGERLPACEPPCLVVCGRKEVAGCVVWHASLQPAGRQADFL